MQRVSYLANSIRKFNSVDEVDSVIQKYFRKGTLSNNYILLEEYKEKIAEESLYLIEGRSNAALLLLRLDFFRLYYFINDPSEVLLLDLDRSVVMEILFRGPKRYPEKEVSYWLQQGFKKHLQRDCYLLKRADVNKIQNSTRSDQVVIRKASTLQDLQYVQKAMELDLDHYTGDMLTSEQIQVHCTSGDVFIVSIDDHYAGFLQAALKNKVYWLEHIVVSSNYRGMGLSKALMNAYIEEGLNKECRSFQLWVINDNIAAVNLYHKYGFQYLNKSTISLLKEANG